MWSMVKGAWGAFGSGVRRLPMAWCGHKSIGQGEGTDHVDPRKRVLVPPWWCLGHCEP